MLHVIEGYRSSFVNELSLIKEGLVKERRLLRKIQAPFSWEISEIGRAESFQESYHN